MPPVITLLTDFGTRDAYVASMKGVILAIAPDATIVDLSHDVPPQDVHEAAWLLRTSFAYFPPGTIHVAVVDPGVGSERRAIAAQSDDMTFVGPDNGVLSWALDAAGRDLHSAQSGEGRRVSVVEIANRAYTREDISATFHGRDVFAPAAAHLANGASIDALGPRIDDPRVLPWPAPRVFDGRIECDVVHVDRFGNLITSLDRATFDGWRGDASSVWIEAVGMRNAHLVRTYADATPGAIVALFGSANYLELAARDTSAAAALGITRGATVVVGRS